MSFKCRYLFIGMCEMVIVQDEPDIWQSKQRKRLGMFHTEDRFVNLFVCLF